MDARHLVIDQTTTLGKYRYVGVEYAKGFPLTLLNALPVGLSDTDLNIAKSKFIIALLKNLEQVGKSLDHPPTLQNCLLESINKAMHARDMAVQRDGTVNPEEDGLFPSLAYSLDFSELHTAIVKHGTKGVGHLDYEAAKAKSDTVISMLWGIHFCSLDDESTPERALSCVVSCQDGSTQSYERYSGILVTVR